jgi:hypothetical protein
MRKLDKYHNAHNTETSTVFSIRKFQSTRIFILSGDEAFVIEAIFGLLTFTAINKSSAMQSESKAGLIHGSRNKEAWDS